MILKKIKVKKHPQGITKKSHVSITIRTEKLLQEIQMKFFSLLQRCKKECHMCSFRECDLIYREFVNTLTPYATSIYKKSYKHRSTLEEMSRVITESVNSLLIDIWHQGKIIHKSFGSMVKWKMLHYLDGKINLFDKEMFTSIDQYTNLMGDTNTSSNSSGEDIIDYYSNYLNTEYLEMDNCKDLLRGDLVDTIMHLIDVSKCHYSKFICPKDKSRIHLKTLYGILRFFQHKDNFIMFQDDPVSKFYYTKTLDLIFSYLDKYKNHN